jgi:hypothetical protein
MTDDWKPDSSAESVLKDAIADVRAEARTYIRNGECFHPMSLRFGTRCIGCGENPAR